MAGDEQHGGGDILGFQNATPMLGGGNFLAKCQDRRVHLAGVDIGHANAVVLFFHAQADAEGRMPNLDAA